MSAQMIDGSCHCGAVRFTARIDPETPTTRCNCSICLKSRMWLTVVSPEDFKLLTGEAALGNYRFGSETIVHRFCTKCGVKTHGTGGDWVAVSVAALDLAPETMSAFEIAYADGRNDRQAEVPAETGYL